MFNPGAAICGQLMHEEEKARADTAPTETKLNIMDFKFFPLGFASKSTHCKI